MRLPMEKATLCVHLLTEGSSIRSTERVTGVHRDTICRLLRKVGAKCEDLLSRAVAHIPVKDVQADELWCFVGMKEKTKHRKHIADPELGDAYTFVGMERHTKLVLAWHLGRRTAQDTDLFAAKLASSTVGDFQLTTDTDGTPTRPPSSATWADGSISHNWSRRTQGRDWTASGGILRPP